jgi:hypothetical protein
MTKRRTHRAWEMIPARLVQSRKLMRVHLIQNPRAGDEEQAAAVR